MCSYSWELPDFGEPELGKFLEGGFWGENMRQSKITAF